MSNLNLWYCAGLVVLGASFSYIVVTAVQFMELTKKQPKTSAGGASGMGPTQFLRHALVAFLGIMIGAQLLQYHQDQEELTRKDIGRDMAIARAVSASPAAAAPIATGAGASTNAAAMGSRPSVRPPRGYFSVAEAEKAGVVMAPAIPLEPAAVPASGSTATSSALAALK